MCVCGCGGGGGGGDEAVAPIIWLYQIEDAQKEEVFFPDFLITLWSYAKNFWILKKNWTMFLAV